MKEKKKAAKGAFDRAIDDLVQNAWVVKGYLKANGL
jgi:hypothetical protein